MHMQKAAATREEQYHMLQEAERKRFEHQILELKRQFVVDQKQIVTALEKNYQSNQPFAQQVPEVHTSCEGTESWQRQMHHERLMVADQQ